MNLNLRVNDLLFLDIETVPQEEFWSEVPEITKKLFIQKTAYQRKENVFSETFYERAGIWAEFGKIICISVGYFVDLENKKQLRLRSFFGDDEHKILTDFKVLLETHFTKKSHVLCAHNGKEFDFPYLCRRMLINGLEIPKSLQLQGKKPWEIIHQDTMEMWKFGDRRSYTSLELLAELMGISGAKADLSGDQVNRVFYKENGLARINEYCLEDVIVVAQLYLRFHFLDLVAPENIVKL